MLEYENIRLVDSDDFDYLVETIYMKPYQFQQQDGCKDRGIVEFSVPMDPDEEYDSQIPIKINGDKMGVSFDTWLNHDVNDKFFEEEWRNALFYERNFYPEFWKLVNDLHSKGHIEEGKYILNIDW